ncbi:MAG: hypothetical protein CSA62_09330 [Planctomycetota bacterium]|nr:MAG: hypothetical protein CSA62_09330 [Planctomycetota bacterium]
MSKTWKVAQREYAENVRTKSFLIGIFLLPVLLTLSIPLLIWLEGKVDVRKYAVEDRSGWLLQAIDARTRFPDLLQMYQDHQRGVVVPESVRQTSLWTALEKVPSDPLREQLVEGMRRIYGMSEEQLAEKFKMAAKLLPGSVVEQLEQGGKQQLAEMRRDVTQIFTALAAMKDSERVKAWTAASRNDRFRRIEVAGGVEEMQRMLDQGQLFAFFVINEDPVTDDEGCQYFSENFTDTGLQRWFEGLATELVRERRIKKVGIDKKAAGWIAERVQFTEKQRDAETGESLSVAGADKLRQWAPAGFVYALWIAIFSIAQMLLTNTIEEKSNRIIEVLLSSVSPLQLMTGKILGIALTGLTMVGAWVSFLILGALGGPLINPKVGEIIHELGVVDIVMDPLYLGSFLVYFLLGYLFFASLLVGIGSVCNTLKESQNLMMPVMLVLMVPLLLMVPIARDPNGMVAQVMSFIPPLTPFVMMNRVGGPPELWEYAVTLLILLVSIFMAFRGAAKVFRIGILLTGKRPGFVEVLRWMFAPSGVVPKQED